MDLKKKMKAFFTLKRHANEGFTLVELIVVIAILAILAGIAVPAYSGYVDKAKMAADQQLLATMNTAFTVACMDNKQYDMTAISPTPTATIASDGTVTVDPYNDTFQTYFGGGTFQYYDKLYFNSDKGVFESRISNFADAGVINVMSQTLNGISKYFSASEAMVNLLRDKLLGNTSTTVSSDVLKFDEMFDELNAAMAEDKVEAYLREKGIPEEEWTDELKATVKGNLGVMHFASAAAGCTAKNVMESMNVVASVLGAGGYECNQEEFESKYLQNLSKDDQEYYNTNVKGQGDAAYEEFLAKTASNGGDFSADYRTLIQMEKAAEQLKAEGKTNTTGISTLGAMYALAAGYYNSEYYNPETDGDKPTSYGEFDSVMMAMGNPSFWTYCGCKESDENVGVKQNSQAHADLEYYLEYMASLSQNTEIDLTDPETFAGMNGQG